MERKQAAELATASLEDTPSALQESSAANSSFASSETSGINTTITTSISSRKRPAAPPALKSFDAENTVLFIPTQLQQPPSQNDCGSILIDGDIISNHHPPISLDEESNHKNNSSNSCHHHEDDDEVDLITRNIVPQTDNPSLPCVTFRVIILGSFWCILLGFINSILVFRTNTFIVDAMLATVKINSLD